MVNYHGDRVQGRNTDGISDLALTTKEIAEVLERMENHRRQEHSKRRATSLSFVTSELMQRGTIHCTLYR
jgi:hypothetical protein